MATKYLVSEPDMFSVGKVRQIERTGFQRA
jgi:hypothetical protein